MSSSSEILTIIACVSFFSFGLYFLQRQKYLVSLILWIAFANYSGILTNVAKLNLPNQPIDQLPRYLDWIVTTPLLLYLLLCKMNIKDSNFIALIIGLDILMIYTGILASKESEYRQKMILYWISNFFFLTLFFLIWRRNPPAHLFYYLFIFWLMYPIIWGLYEFSVIESNEYGSVIPCLDMGAKIGFGFLV